ncbi:uncharacterized protein LOC18433560 [Amborella trichopoda]|uniref:uncharacterized protein LOC18433560 n=1 Tax=Amborella trichopoda TaxID=13333 RepID=UPI0009BEACF7|nr:uncharacterized protein LOC18433560 [Amborella trichopoda]|eukprot:XP_020522491.1 uncharacterized protein LOC18433560 [Amborella trichopoda]
MAILQRKKSHIFSDPPPSPIATGKGTRSAAINDEIFTEYLERSLKIPHLQLPESHFSDQTSRRIPAIISLPSLISRDPSSINRLLSSLKDFGCFELADHALLGDDFSPLNENLDNLFGALDDKKKTICKIFKVFLSDSGHVAGIREEVRWASPEKEEVKAVLRPESCTTVCKNMEETSCGFKKIAEILGQILSENTKNQVTRRIQESEPGLYVNKFSHENFEGTNSYLEENGECTGDAPHALSLHWSMWLRFCFRTPRGSFSFRPDIGNIVVTAGDHLQEWSYGLYESVSGAAYFVPDEECNSALSLTFKCTPSTLFLKSMKVMKKISFCDQLLIALALAFLFNFLTYIYTKFSNTMS